MRKITRQEAAEWMALARAHGFTDADGRVALGRFVVAQDPDGRVRLTFVTPVIAGAYTEDLQPKTPPILFDRTPDGRIILPGRWWQHLFERAAEDESIPAEARRLGGVAARHVFVPDVFLPPDTDTIQMSAPDERGEYVTHEALPPGTEAYLDIRATEGGEEP